MTPTGSPIAAGVVSVLPFLRTLANPVLLGFAGVVVALLGIALTVVLYRRTRVIRQLSFGVTSRPLARVDPTAASRVRLYYANQRITDASVVEITLDNTGSAAIQPSDLAGPVHITFAGTAYGLEDSVDIARAPVGLRPQLTLDRAELSIQPFLLNPGESLSVSLLVANYSEPPVLTARVTGIAELRDQATATHRRRQRTGRACARGGSLLWSRQPHCSSAQSSVRHDHARRLCTRLDQSCRREHPRAAIRRKATGHRRTA
jgi:hypothetical protein